MSWLKKLPYKPNAKNKAISVIPTEEVLAWLNEKKLAHGLSLQKIIHAILEDAMEKDK